MNGPIPILNAQSYHSIKNRFAVIPLQAKRSYKVLFMVKCVSVHQINFYQAINMIKGNFKLRYI